jgi:hypothetical protein
VSEKELTVPLVLVLPAAVVLVAGERAPRARAVAAPDALARIALIAAVVARKRMVRGVKCVARRGRGCALVMVQTWILVLRFVWKRGKEIGRRGSLKNRG